VESLAQGKFCCPTLSGGGNRHRIVHDGETNGDFTRPGAGAIARSGETMTVATLESGMTWDAGIVEQGTHLGGVGTAVG